MAGWPVELDDDFEYSKPGDDGFQYTAPQSKLERVKAYIKKKNDEMRPKSLKDAILKGVGNAGFAVPPMPPGAEKVVGGLAGKFADLIPNQSVAGVVKGLGYDVPMGAAQLASHVTGVGGDWVDKKIDAGNKYMKDNFNPAKAGEITGQNIPFAFGGATTGLSKGAAYGVNALKGALLPMLTPEADLKGDGDYSGRKIKGGIIGGVLGFGVPAVTELATKYGKPVAQKLLQTIFDMTDKNKSTAARRAEALANLNKMNNSELEMTVGQLTGNRRVQKAEAFSESVPFGLAKTREEANQQNLKMLQNRATRSAAERDSTGYRNVDDLVDAAVGGDPTVVGDKNAARILEDLVDPSGSNNAKILDASRSVNQYPLQKRSDELYRMFGEQGDELGPISMAGETGRLKPLISDMERLIGKDDRAVSTARAVYEDMARAQRELFPPKLPDSIYEGFTPSYPQGGVGEFLSGQAGAQTLENVPGSVREFLSRQRPRPKTLGSVFQQPNTGVGQPIQGAERWERPPSNSTTLNASNLMKSISRLKNSANSARGGDDIVAGELDQIVTGMDTKLEQAASANPSVRAALDAAKSYYKKDLLPVKNAGTATSFTGPNGERIAVPEAIALEDKGLAAVRNLADEEALRLGQFNGKRKLEGIDPNIAATVLEDPALNQYYSGASAEERAQLIEILRATANNKKDAATSGSPLAVAKMLMGGSLGIGSAGLLGPAAKKLFTSKLLLENPDWSRQVEQPFSRKLGELMGYELQ